MGIFSDIDDCSFTVFPIVMSSVLYCHKKTTFVNQGYDIGHYIIIYFCLIFSERDTCVFLATHFLVKSFAEFHFKETKYHKRKIRGRAVRAI